MDDSETRFQNILSVAVYRSSRRHELELMDSYTTHLLLWFMDGNAMVCYITVNVSLVGSVFLYSALQIHETDTVHQYRLVGVYIMVIVYT